MQGSLYSCLFCLFFLSMAVAANLAWGTSCHVEVGGGGQRRYVDIFPKPASESSRDKVGLTHCKLIGVHCPAQEGRSKLNCKQGAMPTILPFENSKVCHAAFNHGGSTYLLLFVHTDNVCTHFMCVLHFPSVLAACCSVVPTNATPEWKMSLSSAKAWGVAVKPSDTLL